MDYETRQELYIKYKNLAYYFLIGILSLISVVFLPFIGSVLQGEFAFPTTVAGWIIYILSKLAVSVLNVLLFYCFIKQAKVNVKNDPKFIEAEKMLEKANSEEHIEPRSPKKYFGGVWTKKGIMLFLTTFLTCFALSEALLTFDLSSFLSYLFTVVMGIIMGYLQMRQTEDYWTSEYNYYAQMRLKEFEEKEKKDDYDRRKTIQESSGTSCEESTGYSDNQTISQS